MSDSVNRNPSNFEIDLSYLSEIASGSADFMIDMIDIFLEQTPVYLEQLAEAVKNQDWKGTGDVAHKIKPTLAFMGVEPAKDAMSEIERKARNLDALDTIQADLDYIMAMSDTLYSKLNDHRKELEAQL